jgi:hypothetical protein
MQMKTTQKRPEPQKLLSGRILGDTPDLPTRSVGGHRGIKPFPTSLRVRGAGAIAAASDDSSGTLASPNASGIQMPPHATALRDFPESKTMNKAVSFRC